VTEPGRLHPAVKGLAAVSFGNDVASEMVYPLLPALVAGLGGGPTTLGILDGASDLAASALRWWSGRLADRVRARGPLVAVGYALATFLRPALSAVSAGWQVIGVRVADRIGKGLRSPARDAMIADLTPTPLLGKAFGLHRSADHLGAVLGSLLAFELLRRGWEVRDVLAGSLFPGLVALLLLIAVLKSGAARQRGSGAAGAAGAGEAAGAGAASLLPLAALAAVRFPETLLLYRLQQLGAPIPAVPLLWALLHVVRSVASYPSGLVADRLGVRPALVVGTVLHGAVLVGLGATGSAAAAVVLFLLNGVVIGVAEPAERAAVARLATTKRGQAFGRYQALAGVGALAFGAGFGWTYQAIGPVPSFTAAALAVLVVVGWWLALERKATN
jgi:MFS family permease